MISSQEAQALTDVILKDALDRIEAGIKHQAVTGKYTYTFQVPHFQRELHNYLKTRGFDIAYKASEHFMHINWSNS